MQEKKKRTLNDSNGCCLGALPVDTRPGCAIRSPPHPSQRHHHPPHPIPNDMVMQSVPINILLALLSSLPIGVGSQPGGPSSSNGCCTYPGAYTPKCTSLTLPAMGAAAAEGDCAWTTTSPDPRAQPTEYPNAPAEPLNPHCGYEGNCSDVMDCGGHWCSFAPTAGPTSEPPTSSPIATSSPTSSVVLVGGGGEIDYTVPGLKVRCLQRSRLDCPLDCACPARRKIIFVPFDH